VLAIDGDAGATVGELDDAGSAAGAEVVAKASGTGDGEVNDVAGIETEDAVLVVECGFDHGGVVAGRGGREAELGGLAPGLGLEGEAEPVGDGLAVAVGEDAKLVFAGLEGELPTEAAAGEVAGCALPRSD